MITACELAGTFAAHAIWCVSDGDSLVPMLAYTTESNEQRMERLVIDDDLEKSVIHGKQKLVSNPMDSNDAVLLYDGRISLESEKVDAIIIEIRAYFSPQSEAVLAVPYTPVSSGAFCVHNPKLLGWENCEDFDVNSAIQAFFDGVNKHEKGARVWADHLDESQ